MSDRIIYLKYSFKEIYILKDLWLELNKYHVPKVTTFKDRFTNPSFEKHVYQLKKSDELFAFVALDKQIKIGFIIVATNGDIAEIDSIFVKEEYRNCGIGNKLIRLALNEIVNKYSEIIMKVAEGNEQHFHSCNHFKKRYTVFQYDYNDSE